MFLQVNCACFNFKLGAIAVFFLAPILLPLSIFLYRHLFTADLDDLDDDDSLKKTNSLFFLVFAGILLTLMLFSMMNFFLVRASPQNQV